MLLLNSLPVSITFGVAFVCMLLSLGFLLYRSGFRGLVAQSRLVLFVLVTSIYNGCAMEPAISFFTKFTIPEIVAYFGCLVNNWVESQLHRHPGLEKCENSHLRSLPFLFFEVTVFNALATATVIVFFSKDVWINFRRKKRAKVMTSETPTSIDKHRSVTITFSQ